MDNGRPGHILNLRHSRFSNLHAPSMKILLAMSGGVDSSVAAALLRDAGHEVVGVFMRLGSPGESLDELIPVDACDVGKVRICKQGCCSVGDAEDARLVAAKLDIHIPSATTPEAGSVGKSKGLTPADYLTRILNAKVYDVAKETPLDVAERLSARLNNTVLLKREDQQPVFSFKLRGAYNKMAHLSATQLKRGVICASAGNHAQGVALSARKLGTKAFIVMPVTTPQVKVDAVRGLGGEVVLHGESYSDAHTHAVLLEQKKGLTFVHPFDDPDVIAGQGTVAM